MESFFSLPHECTSLEFWLNYMYMWCFAIAGWSVTCVVLALLPKLINDCAPLVALLTPHLPDVHMLSQIVLSLQV